MSVDNPLADNSTTDHEDQSLVMRARSGDRQALEDLVRRHQGWIFSAGFIETSGVLEHLTYHYSFHGASIMTKRITLAQVETPPLVPGGCAQGVSDNSTRRSNSVTLCSPARR